MVSHKAGNKTVWGIVHNSNKAGNGYGEKNRHCLLLPQPVIPPVWDVRRASFTALALWFYFIVIPAEGRHRKVHTTAMVEEGRACSRGQAGQAQWGWWCGRGWAGGGRGGAWWWCCGGKVGPHPWSHLIMPMASRQ